jgi:opacity protein-like surface antigen
VLPTAVLRRAALACALLCAFFSWSGRAHAEFKEWKIAVTPAYAVGYVDERTGHGGGGGLEVGFGITESLSLHASGFLSWHSLDPTMKAQGGTMSAYASMLGLTYTLDVIRLVPYFEVQLGVVGTRGTAGFGDDTKVVQSSNDFALGVGFGMDFLVTRNVAVGFVIRYHALLTDITRIPVYLYFGPRVSFRFGG